MALYLIKRGPRPSYHKAPFHPVIICAKKSIAKWEAGWTGDRAWVWSRENDPYSGWLLERWEGLDIDYGHIVRGCTLPDGTQSAFWHDDRSLPWALMKSAVWWDDKRMPKWIEERGVVYPPDEHSQQQILDFLAEERSEREHRKRVREAAPNTVVIGFSCSGFGRQTPDFWPKGLSWEEWDALQCPSE